MSESVLRRRLGAPEAVAIGLASMVGAGVFTAFAPAASAAGAGLLAGLALAAVLAFCNATSTAQLAAVHPVAGGAYTYGRAELGPWWGFVAGWSFVVGKTASIGAMALTAAAYLAPRGFERPAAILAILALTAVNLRGITRTAAAGAVLVALTLAGLLLACSVALPAWRAPWTSSPPFDLYGVLQAGGLLFFAFAGYARIATLGEEVRDPARTIPRAIGIALAIVIALYAVVGVTLLGVLGPRGLAASAAPVEAAVRASGGSWAVPVVAGAAGIGSLGALLALAAGLGRTVLAMAREGDLPRRLAVVSARAGVPARAQLTVAAVACLLVAVADLRTAIGFSSFGVLLYYGVANIAALHQTAPARRYPRVVQVGGAVGCLLLVATVPVPSLLAGTAVLAVGIVLRLLRRSGGEHPR